VVAFWERVSRCETGGNWRMNGSMYEGGLGIYRPNWDWWAGELGLLRRYPRAWMAPKLVQIQVAQTAYVRHRGAWGCFAVTGRPPDG
jgi:hypothetical protein